MIDLASCRDPGRLAEVHERVLSVTSGFAVPGDRRRQNRTIGWLPRPEFDPTAEGIPDLARSTGPLSAKTVAEGDAARAE